MSEHPLNTPIVNAGKHLIEYCMILYLLISAYLMCYCLLIPCPMDELFFWYILRGDRKREIFKIQKLSLAPNEELRYNESRGVIK